MAHIEVNEAQAWLEQTKASLGGTLDPDMEESIAAQVLSRVASSYDTSGWVSPETTPSLVRKVIGMKYASWFYHRLYSADEALSDYALLLNAHADTLLEGIATGANDLPEVEGEDISASLGPSYEDSSPVFTMGRVF